MNEYVIANKTDIDSLADAFRIKLGTTELLSLEDMVAAIDNIPKSYVISAPAVFTLSASSWNGTRYTLVADNYKVGANGVQIGLPSNISTVKAQDAIKAALTITKTTTNTSSVTISISAVNAPTKDLDIAIFGLEAIA